MELPEKAYFVSRKGNPVLPDKVRGYEPGARMDVYDLSGKKLSFIALNHQGKQ
jgi:hypothetical protein